MKTDPKDLNGLEGEMGTLREIWAFLRVRKKFWLAPIIIMLMLLGLLMFVAGSAGPLSPFLYGGF